MTNNKEIMINGLWKNNPLIQLLGLCPLLAVSTTVTNALGLGLATTLVLISTNFTVSALRNIILKEIRIPIFVMIIASLVTCVELLINAFAINLYNSLGIFIPLIVTNCIVIGRAESFASKHPIIPSILDGFWMGMGMTLTLIALGTIRELLGNGSIFTGANNLLGEWAQCLTIQVLSLDNTFLLAMLPPGAFICTGFLIALINYINKKHE